MLTSEINRLFQRNVLVMSQHIGFEDWRAWIVRMLGDCVGAVALWSRFSLPSQWIYVEVGVCWFAGKQLVNLLLDRDQIDQFRATPFEPFQAHDIRSADTLRLLVATVAARADVAAPEVTDDLSHQINGSIISALDRRGGLSDRLRATLVKTYPRLLNEHANLDFRPLVIGETFFPGRKQGVEIRRNPVRNEVHVRGRVDNDAPSFGAFFEQPVRQPAEVAMSVEIRALGTSDWQGAFFRVEADDQDKTRTPLQPVAPVQYCRPDDWYVQKPALSGERVLYQFRFDPELRVLTRLQVVLAPNSLYDLIFRDFMILEYE